MLDERTEQLINRKLDGELTEAESLELDKLLIRSPEAQTYLAEQQRIDESAGDALRAALSEPKHATAWPGDFASQPPYRRKTWHYYLRPAAAAAAIIVLAVLVATYPDGRSPTKSTTPSGITAQHDSDRSQLAKLVDKSHDMPMPIAGHDPRFPLHERPTRIIGVFDDETQSLYLLEMNPRPRQDPLIFVNY